MTTAQGPLVHSQNAHNFPLVMLCTGSDTADLLALCAARFGTRYHAVASLTVTPAGSAATAPPLAVCDAIESYHVQNSDEDYCCTAPYVDHETGKTGVVVAVNHRYHDARSAAISVGWIDKNTEVNVETSRAITCPNPTADREILPLSPMTKAEQLSLVRTDVAKGAPAPDGPHCGFLRLDGSQVTALKERRGLTRNEVGFAVVCVAFADRYFQDREKDRLRFVQTTSRTLGTEPECDARPQAWVMHTVRPRGDSIRGDFSYVTTPFVIPNPNADVDSAVEALKAHVVAVKRGDRDWPDPRSTMPPAAMMLDSWLHSDFTHPLGRSKDCRFDLRTFLPLIARLVANIHHRGQQPQGGLGGHRDRRQR